MLGWTVRRLIILGITGAVAVLLAGFANALHPLFDTLAHFRLHLAVALLLASPVLVFIKRTRLALASLATGLLGIWFAASGTPFVNSSLPALENKSTHQMFHLNLQWNNREKQKVVARILDIDPAFIAISEVGTSWKAVLKKLDQNWPHKAHCPEWSVRGGVMLYSKWRLDSSNDYCGDFGSLLITRVHVPDGSKITVGVTHPRWPWPASGPRQYSAMVSPLKSTGPDMLVAGDFNATTWSHAIGSFAEAGNLEVYRGIGATWLIGDNSKPLVRLFGLPIDNVMSKGRVRVLSVETLEAMGSDHLPMLIRFQIEGKTQ